VHRHPLTEDQWRRLQAVWRSTIATRFEKTARNFLALTQVVGAWLWLAPN
jgi:hypothetical protein